MPRLRSLVIGLPFLILVHPLGGQARPAPTIVQSYERARSLIADAVAAHGGVEALRAAQHVRLTQEGFEYHRTQGRRVAPPRDSTVRRTDMMIDLPGKRIVSTTTRGWPGGFFYTTRFVSSGDKHYTVAPRNETYSVQQFPPVAEQYGNLLQVPHWYLLTAFEGPGAGARRYLGRLRIASGVEVEAIHITIPPSGSAVIGIDPRTKQLRAVTSVGTDVFTGDTEVSTEFLDWTPHGGLLAPSRIVQWRGGEIATAMRVTSVTPGYVIPDSVVTPPAHFTVAPPFPPAQPVQELAPGVWSVGTGSRSLVVAFDDHLVVVDAPSGGSADVITRARTIAPGKPIRFVIPTHHHDDHMVGARYHAANGSTIVTTSGNLEYLRRLMTAPMSSVMLAANQVPPNSRYRVETIDGDRRIFSDGKRTLEIHRIQSPHADDMLVAWLPAEGILFHADLVEAPPSGPPLRGANAETTIHLASVIKRNGWNVRFLAGAHGHIDTPAVFDQLAALPLVPPGR